MSIFEEIPTELKPLLPYEEKLLQAVIEGEVCRPEEETAPHEIRAKLLRKLCVDKKLADYIHRGGIKIEGAFVSGTLNLFTCTVPFPLRFRMCDFEESIDLRGAVVPLLDFSGSSVKEIDATNLKVEHGILFCAYEDPEKQVRKSFSTSGVLRLEGARTEGNLYCDGGIFRSSNRQAIYAENIKVQGFLLMRNATVDGMLNLMSATVGKNFECDHTLITNPGETAILAANMTVEGVLSIREATIEGTLDLMSVTVGKNFECDGTHITNPGKIAILAANFTGKENVHLREGFISEGELNFMDAKISGTLDCQSASFNNPDGYALLGDGLKPTRILFRHGFKANGEVKLYHSKMGELDCTGGLFSNPGKTCFDGTLMAVEEALKWLGTCEGRVILKSAKVGDLEDREQSWPQEPGMLDLNGFEYKSLPSEPHIARQRLKWLSSQFRKKDWMAEIRRFTDRLRNQPFRGPSKRREVPRPPFPAVQPYEQLALVLQNMGWKDEAKAVQIAKNNFITRYSTGRVKLSRGIWSLVDYGYGPIKAVVPIVLLVLVGLFIFQQADRVHLMTYTGKAVTTGEEQEPIFDPLLYSADVFLPFVNLHQEDSWGVDPVKPEGQKYIYYMSVHIIAGWFFTTLFLAAVAGLVKTE